MNYLIEQISLKLSNVDGIESFVIDGRYIYAISNELSKVNWDEMVNAIDCINQKFPQMNISVWARQGKTSESIFENHTIFEVKKG